VTQKSAASVSLPLEHFKIPRTVDWDSVPILKSGDTKAVDVSTLSGCLILCKALVEVTHVAPSFGFNNSRNPFWNQVVLLDWLQSSGRLTVFQKNNTLNIDSWWTKVCRALVVSPFIAMREIGMFDCNVSGIAKAEVQELTPAVSAWGEFFTFKGEDLLHFVYLNDTAPEFLTKELVREYWKAQCETLACAFKIYFKQFKLMPRPEKLFSLGWLRATNLLAETGKNIGVDWFMGPGSAFLQSMPTETLLINYARGKNRSVQEKFIGRIIQLGSLFGPFFLVLKTIWRRTFNLDFMSNKEKQEKALKVLLWGNPLQFILCLIKIFFLAMLPNIKYKVFVQFPIGSLDEKFMYRSYQQHMQTHSDDELRQCVKQILGEKIFKQLTNETEVQRCEIADFERDKQFESLEEPIIDGKRGGQVNFTSNQNDYFLFRKALNDSKLEIC